MRILRIRRGFTTNSSGANEYLPEAGKSATPAPSASARDAGAADARATGELTSVDPWGPAAPQSEPPSNSSAMGVIFVVVLGAFVAGPIVRMIVRRKKKES